MLDKDDAKEILAAKYYRENLVALFKELFPDFEGEQRKYDQGKFNSCMQIGQSKSCDIKIFEVIVPRELQNQRVGITKEMFRLFKEYHQNNALVLFVNEDRQNYRLSLLTTTYGFGEKGIEKIQSNPRRYSYYLGEGSKTRTVYDLFFAKGPIHTIDQLIDRFSVEVVNKQFYKEIAQAFTKLIGGKFAGEEYTRILGFEKDVAPSKYSEFAVRLIGRLIFCWFLKEKKSEAGKPLLPDESLFGELIINSSENYYLDVLQPLFFELLDTPFDKRQPSLHDKMYDQIPYLNGGLFSPHSGDFYNSLSDRNVHIPNEWFIDFFTILRQYNFTVDESTSYDIELSIDPEMLGRIFENLLAEIDPETGENARKNSGSYYTPRDIVEFMVDESLVEHLKNSTGIEEDKLRDILRCDFTDALPVNETEINRIIDSLYKIKILDPACGSGAFPIGVLQRIIDILQKIDPDNKYWVKKIENDPDVEDEFKREINSSSAEYVRKSLVIRKSIFGVDIQPIAVEISRLRCFLSLIIEERIDDSAPNRGIKPLPNLDFKFAVGNTLIGLEADDDTVSLFDDYDLMEKLSDLRKEWFSADRQKREILKKKIMEIQESMIDDDDEYRSSKSKRISKWHPFNNDENDWFDPEWMFGEKYFDIVIGNPPYIQLQKRANPSNADDLTKFGDIYENCGYKTFARTGDMYCLFYERGFELLKNNGILSFITSNKWMRAGYAAEPDNPKEAARHCGLRKFLSEKNPLVLLDFSGEKVFEAATVDVSILICQNAVNSGHTQACIATKQCRENLSNFIKQNSRIYSFASSGPWLITDSIVQQIKNKVEKKGLPLKDWNISFFRGILTGYNDAFIIDGATKNKLISEDPKSAEIIRPILRGKDIKRYEYNFADIWLINVHNGIPEKAINPVNIEDYPAIKRYLDQYIDIISVRQDQGETPYNLRSCAYMDDFSKPKLMYSEITQRLSFCYIEQEMYCSNTAYFISNNPHLKYILACLNSKLYDFYYKVVATQLGKSATRMLAMHMRELPLPVVDKDTENKFEMLINNIIDGHDIDESDKLIDQMLYTITGLDDDEIYYIEEMYKK